MAIEKEIKILVPEGADLTRIIPADAKRQHVTQVYLAPEKTGIQIRKSRDTVSLLFQSSGNAEAITITGEQNLAAFQDLSSSSLSILDQNGNVDYDGINTEIRIRTKNDQAFLTIKKKTKSAAIRNEFEFEIPATEAARLKDEHIADGTAKIEKTRYSWKHDGSTYEFDCFSGANHGLTILEIENPPAHLELVTIAAGATDVTQDERFKNRQLAERPYNAWGASYRGGIGGTGGRQRA